MNLSNAFKEQNSSNTLPTNPAKCEIGKGTYSNGKLDVFPHKDASLKIGAYCSFAPQVKILLGEHRTDWVTTFPFSQLWNQAKSIPGHPGTKGDVTIGNDVWVGTGVIILSGLTISDGAVIGAGSVVTKDVPPYCVYAGNPAKFIKKRFDDTTIERLLKVKWWDWDDSKIAEAMPLMLSDNIETFLDYAENI